MVKGNLVIKPKHGITITNSTTCNESLMRDNKVNGCSIGRAIN